MCGFDRKLVNQCTARKWTWPALESQHFDGMFERSSISGRTSLNTSSASSSWQPQPISLQIGTSVVYSDTWSHVARSASDMVHETTNVKPHKCKPCFQEFAQLKLLHQRLTRQIGNHTFVFRRHCGIGWLAITCKNLLRRKQ